MYSRVELVDAHTRRRQVLTVCYPEDAEPAAGFISVLSPVGISLLGLKTGDIAKWLTPTGEECAAEIAAILFQPEATGDYPGSRPTSDRTSPWLSHRASSVSTRIPGCRPRRARMAGASHFESILP